MMFALCCIVLCFILNAESVVATECTELQRSMCADHFGTEIWRGSVPNLSGLDLEALTVEFYHFFALLYQENYCSHLLHYLLCLHYFPLCSTNCSISSLVTASRELCVETLEACLPYARTLYGSTSNGEFPRFINCSSLEEMSYNQDCLTNENSSTIAEPCCSTDGGKYYYLPNATIHIDFCPPIGSRMYQAMENESSIEVCVVLANVGSYDPSARLDESITLILSPRETKTSFLHPAKLEEDYSLQETELTVPEGNIRGTKLCTRIGIFDDYLKEGRETFSVEVSSIADLMITFGSGKAKSPGSSSIEVIIIDNDEPFIPEEECRTKCSVRNRANSNTFSQNSYTYAVHAQAISRLDSDNSSQLDIVLLECWDISSEAVCPPKTQIRYSIPVCQDCTLEFESGHEYLIAGKHRQTIAPGKGLYLPSNRKGGLLSPWRKNYNSVAEWIQYAKNQTSL